MTVTGTQIGLRGVTPTTALVQKIELGSTDTTLTRVSPGVVAVEDVALSKTGHTHTAADVIGALSWATVPGSAAAPGTAGQMAYANGFLYICVAANQWQRVALTAW